MKREGCWASNTGGTEGHPSTHRWCRRSLLIRFALHPDRSDGAPHAQASRSLRGRKQSVRRGRGRGPQGPPGAPHLDSPHGGQTHVPRPQEAGARQGVASQYRPEPERRRETLPPTASAPTLCPTPSRPPHGEPDRGTGDKGLEGAVSAGRQGCGPASPVRLPAQTPPGGQSGNDCRGAGTRGEGSGRGSHAPGQHKGATVQCPRLGVLGRERGVRLLSGPFTLDLRVGFATCSTQRCPPALCPRPATARFPGRTSVWHTAQPRPDAQQARRP